MNSVFFSPIIPVFAMAVLCVGMLIIKPRSVGAFVRRLLIVLLLFAINLRPMTPGEQLKVEVEDKDLYVLFVIDDTISMIADDVALEEGRLSAVKRDCTYIVEQLTAENVVAKYGAIAFHNNVSILSPFTDNGEHVINTIAGLYPIEELYARGTTLNKPKETMLMQLKEAEKRGAGNSRTVVFFMSDGEITDDSVLDSYAALKNYIDGGAVLGYGTQNGGKMHLKSFFDEETQLVMDSSTYPPKAAISRLEEKNLKQLAKDMGVEYIHMEKSEYVDSVLGEIKTMYASLPDNIVKQSQNQSVTGADDLYYLFVMPLILLLVIEIIIWIRRKEEV